LDLLYGQNGLAPWSVTDDLNHMAVPRVRWVAETLGIDAGAALRLVFMSYVGGLACLLIGWHTRVMAVLAWLTHLALNASGAATTYGVDSIANTALFYCTWMPVGATLSLDLQTGRESGAPSALARLSLRVLQLQLCVVYLASGLEKASGSDWWTGEAVW